MQQKLRRRLRRRVLLANGGKAVPHMDHPKLGSSHTVSCPDW